MAEMKSTFKEFYGQTFLEAVEKMDPKEVVKRPEVKALWDKGFLWSLAHRRGHRWTRGYEPLEDAFFDYKTTKEPVPLNEVETAILCFAAAGATGLAVNDMSSNRGYGAKQFERRTFSLSAEGIYGQLMFINDDGIFHYNPHVPTKMVEIEKQEDMEIIFRAFKEGITRIGEPIRGGPEAPFADSYPVAQLTFHQGQTQFLPAADTVISLQHFLVRLFDDSDPKRRKQPIDELTGKLMCARHWVDDGYLQGIRVPWGMLENTCLSDAGMICGMMIHNIDLVAAAMGLGTYKFMAVLMQVLLGGTPAMKGLGVQFASDKKGYMYPVGIKGMFQAQVPPFFSIDDAADAYYEAIWGPGGRCRLWVKEGDEVIYRGYSSKPRAVHRPFKDNEGWLQAANLTPEEKPGGGPFTPQCRQIIKEVYHYLWDTYGRIPRSIDPMWFPFLIQVQHIPIDFYDRYFKEGAVSLEQREHLKVWHGLNEE